VSSFSYSRDIPDGPNNPTQDQPNMKINTNSIEDILNVDHVTFRQVPGGTHKQLTISSKNVAGLQTDPQSVVYTDNGTASTVAQLFFRNQNRIFHLSPIRAWGFADSSGAISNSQSFNVSTSIKNSAGNYSVTLVANAVSTDKFAVLVSYQSNTPTAARNCSYAITGVGTFDLFFNVVAIPQDPVNFSFIVLQI